MISEFTTDIRFVKGTDNAVTGAISRLGVNQCSPEHLAVPYAELAATLRIDSKLQNLRRYSTTFAFEDVQMAGVDNTIACDVSTG